MLPGHVMLPCSHCGHYGLHACIKPWGGYRLQRQQLCLIPACLMTCSQDLEHHHVLHQDSTLDLVAASGRGQLSDALDCGPLGTSHTQRVLWTAWQAHRVSTGSTMAKRKGAHHVDSVEGIGDSVYKCCMKPPEYLQHSTKHVQTSASILRVSYSWLQVTHDPGSLWGPGLCSGRPTRRISSSFGTTSSITKMNFTRVLLTYLHGSHDPSRSSVTLSERECSSLPGRVEDYSQAWDIGNFPLSKCCLSNR